MATTALKLLVPRIPLLLKTSLFHTLSLTDNASKWDLKATLIITAIRSIMSESKSTITDQQAFSLKEPNLAKDQLVSKVGLAVPEEDDIRQLLFKIIAELDEPDRPKDAETYAQPDLRPVTGEWTGWRDPAQPRPTPAPSDAETYEAITAMATSPLTILYFHGGAHYLMDPASHRATTSKLARLTGGRAFSVRYRLAPQNPFPAALLDAFVAYMNILYPAEGALHEAVKPEHIIFAGDSAGGNLGLSLLLLVLQVGRSAKTVRWNGKEVEVPVPGGVATNSAWYVPTQIFISTQKSKANQHLPRTDVTRSLPSLTTNAHYDYLPPVFRSDSDSSSPLATPTSPQGTGVSPKNPNRPPPCPAWPQPPPRADLYTTGPLLCHPLVSPLAAPVALWRGSPPMYFCAGEEMLSDEIKVVVGRCVRAGAGGGRVRYEGFEAMPHCFAMVLEGSKVAERCFNGWAGWMKGVVGGVREGGTTSEAEAEVPLSGGVWIAAPGLEETEVDLEAVTELGDEEVEGLMRREMASRIEVWEEGSR